MGRKAQTMSRQDAFEHILASLHEAALDDARWSAASALIDEACGAKGNFLVFGDGQTHGDIEVFFARFCYRGQRHEELERLYFEVYHPTDERMPRLRQLPDSRLVPVSDLYTDAEKKTSPTYNEGLPLSDTANSLNVRLEGPQGLRIVWSIADPVDSEGWTSERVGTIERLLPHLRRFVGIRQALAEAGALGTSLTELLDNTRFGLVQLERRGRIVAANDVALDILRRGDGLRDEGDFLRAVSPEDDEALQGLLARALPPYGGQAINGSMMVSRPPPAPRLVVNVTPVGARHMDFRPRDGAALVLVFDAGARARADRGSVAAVLGLTPTESEVAVLLAEGRSVRDVAEAMGRSYGTVRWHLKHIFTKLGISRQVELVRAVLSLAGSPASRH